MYKAYDRKRLSVYLILSFGLTFLWYALTVPWGETWDELSVERQNLVSLGMLFPAVAHLLTRRITKEGFALCGKG